MTDGAQLLEVSRLKAVFDTDRGPVTAVEDVGFRIRGGESLGIVGESGCGKSVTALSIMRLLGSRGRLGGGEILFDGEDLAIASERRMREIRGDRISMIFQEPMTALNPVLSVGFQLREAIRLHKGSGRDEADARALDLLRRVGIPRPEMALHGFPHELSGGMRQRVMIAMALACGPQLLIADEPTTALDVTIQAQILQLIKELHDDYGTSLLLITHDMGVVAEMVDSVVVLYAGQVVERADIFDLFDRPLHPYTKGLLASIPRLDDAPGLFLSSIPGTVPDIGSFSSGCRFAPRCAFSQPGCAREAPGLADAGAGHLVRCFLVAS